MTALQGKYYKELTEYYLCNSAHFLFGCDFFCTSLSLIPVVGINICSHFISALTKRSQSK